MTSPDRPMPDGYDVIGDVHGHADALVELLMRLGYAEVDGAWQHPTRRVVFVGDLIDRGPEQVRCYRIARAMVEQGSAEVIVGNHEFNAVAFHTRDPGKSGEFLRRHTGKNLDQHRAFLEQVGNRSALHDEMITWFKTLPLWLDLSGLRVVHACWDVESMEALRPLGPDNSLTEDLVIEGSDAESPMYLAIETLLKGPEIRIDPPYRDKDGNRRTNARFAWWRGDATTLDRAAVIPGGVRSANGDPYPLPLSPTPIVPPVPPYTDEIPVIYGHYWATGTPTKSGPYTACVDYSAGKGGPLVAYRWSGESALDDDNFVSSVSL